MSKGLSVERCVEKATEYISEYGLCLLLFDVQGSRQYTNRPALQSRLEEMIADLDKRFAKHLPENDLAIRGTKERGFGEVYLGDASWAGIKDPKIIPEIIAYQEENYDIKLYWGVAKDGYDNRSVAIVGHALKELQTGT